MDVYGTSTATLSATSSYDCDHGLFARMPRYHHHSGNDVAGHWTIFLDRQGPDAHLGLDKEYLSTHGWTFQERLVAPRTLHFRDAGIVWDCSEASLEEGVATLWGKRGLKMGFTTLVRRDLQDTDTASKDKDERAALQQKWNDWISDFSNRNLTKLSDKLPAVAGIARSFTARCDDKYIRRRTVGEPVAGQPGLDALLQGSVARPARGSGLPSWSWASVSGQLSFHDFEPEPSKEGLDMVVREINVVEKRPGSYGEIEPVGYITAEGMLQLVELDRSAEMRNPNGPFYPCCITDGLVPDVDIECWMDEMEYEDSEEPYECWCLRVLVQ